MTAHLRMLFIASETFPTSRVDVEVLFARELHARGHEIDFVMQAASETTSADVTGAWQGRRVLLGPTDTRDGFFHRLRRHWLSFRHDLRCLRRASRKDYDCIQVRDKYLIAAIGVVVARRRRLPFFYWLSFPAPESHVLRGKERSARYPLLSLLRGVGSGLLLYRWILPRSDHVFVQSEVMRRDVCARGIDAGEVTPVPMGVDMGEVATQASRQSMRRSRTAGAADTTIELAYLGVVATERRIEVLVDMLAELRRAGVRASLVIIGDAKQEREREALEERAVRLGVRDQVEITGFLPRRQAMERAARADIGLSPIFRTPVFEVASPTKLIEYMALGLPVVANDHPEQRQVLRESRAGVCTPWSARHFARAVAWLARCERAQLEAMGARGREWVEANRSYARIADELERKYLELISPACPRTVRPGKQVTVPQ